MHGAQQNAPVGDPAKPEECMKSHGHAPTAHESQTLGPAQPAVCWFWRSRFWARAERPGGEIQCGRSLTSTRRSHLHQRDEATHVFFRKTNARVPEINKSTGGARAFTPPVEVLSRGYGHLPSRKPVGGFVALILSLSRSATARSVSPYTLAFPNWN